MRNERGKATRDRLIVAARGLFGERGYDGTSIDAVLDATGVKRGALYHHFESKQALFDAVLDRVVSDGAQTAAEAARARTTPSRACAPVAPRGCGWPWTPRCSGSRYLIPL